MSLVFRSSRTAPASHGPGQPPLDGERVNHAPVLFANQVEKTYPNGTVALERVKLAIQPGEFVSLLGPSGCGKSTLLKAVGGYLHPTEGQMLLNGAVVTKPGADRVFVFQEFDQLLPWKTVLGNVMFPMRENKIGAAEAEQRARAAGHCAAWPAFPSARDARH